MPTTLPKPSRRYPRPKFDNDRQARADLIAARQALAAAADGATEETDAYLVASARVIEAERALPAWKRVDIDAGLYDDPR